jgi:hypothetical protein
MDSIATAFANASMTGGAGSQTPRSKDHITAHHRPLLVQEIDTHVLAEVLERHLLRTRAAYASAAQASTSYRV